MGTRGDVDYMPRVRRRNQGFITIKRPDCSWIFLEKGVRQCNECWRWLARSMEATFVVQIHDCNYTEQEWRKVSAAVALKCPNIRGFEVEGVN